TFFTHCDFVNNHFSDPRMRLSPLIITQISLVQIQQLAQFFTLSPQDAVASGAVWEVIKGAWRIQDKSLMRTAIDKLFSYVCCFPPQKRLDIEKNIMIKIMGCCPGMILTGQSSDPPLDDTEDAPSSFHLDGNV